MSRVIGYIDGFNLYFGLRERNWHQFYWLDPHLLIQNLLSADHQLVGSKYFTARVRGPKEKSERQSMFLDAINAVSETEVILGRFYKKPMLCRACNSEWTSHEEKMTDSAIASNLVADAFLGGFDTAVLIGGDTDIVPAVKMVKRNFPNKRLLACFPPARRNQEVERCCDDSVAINGAHLAASIMPVSIRLDNGVEIRCPEPWKPQRAPSSLSTQNPAPRPGP